jgi:hypothetical protein
VAGNENTPVFCLPMFLNVHYSPTMSCLIFWQGKNSGICLAYDLGKGKTRVSALPEVWAREKLGFL